VQCQSPEGGVPPGGPALLTFGEAVTGIAATSIPIRRFDPDSPPGTGPAWQAQDIPAWKPGRCRPGGGRRTADDSSLSTSIRNGSILRVELFVAAWDEQKAGTDAAMHVDPRSMTYRRLGTGGD
jgi:hypothetical protein